MDNYLAHSPTETSPEGQLLYDHLKNVSALSALFCAPFHAEACGEAAGLLHDIGKYSVAFQKRLFGSKTSVDHSSAGALELLRRRDVPSAVCVAGHHGGLPDLGSKNDLDNTFSGRINKIRQENKLEDCSAWKREIVPAEYTPRLRFSSGLESYFYVKMLYSALTDADWLDTDAYYSGADYVPPSYDLRSILDKLTEHISAWWDPKEEINVRRCKILRAAIDHGADAPGLFSMTVPTGGGKTIASMAFALHHAAAHEMRRVIYVIPYCSIIDQTRDVFEKVFGAENITAHYSGAEYDYRENAPDRRAFSADNWDAPIILTTAVQFFESLYAAKPGKCRKLHNIAKSVIVFDEAQMLPVPFFRPCLAGIWQLTQNFGCSAVLCTATQPAVARVLDSFSPGLPVRELCPAPVEMYQAFRRVSYVDEGTLSNEELAEMLRERRHVLCIVNSRRQAQELYEKLNDEEGCFHLSTLMTPKDRKRVLDEIRARLRRGKDGKRGEQPCRVISTSLVEAGVDLDFPEVFRALAGLDSVIQAGGRCNREGKDSPKESIVHVFHSKAPRMLEQNIAAAEMVLRKYPREADSPEAIRAYFEFLLYTLRGEAFLDEKKIVPCAEKAMFSTVADRFHLIDGADYTVYIPVDEEGAALIGELRERGPSRSLLRRLGPYSVGVYRGYYEKLRDGGALESVSDNAGILLDMLLYSRETGLPSAFEGQADGIFM